MNLRLAPKVLTRDWRLRSPRLRCVAVEKANIAALEATLKHSIKEDAVAQDPCGE